MGIISTRRQYHQWNTINECSTIFTSQLSTNRNNIQQDSYLHQTFEHNTSPTQYLFLDVSPSTNTRSRSTDKNTTSPEATTLPIFPSLYLSQTDFDTKIEKLLASYNDNNPKQDAQFKETKFLYDKKSDAKFEKQLHTLSFQIQEDNI